MKPAIITILCISGCMMVTRLVTSATVGSKAAWHSELSRLAGLVSNVGVNHGAPPELGHLRDYAKKVPIPSKYTKRNRWGQSAGLALDRIEEDYETALRLSRKRYLGNSLKNDQGSIGKEMESFAFLDDAIMNVDVAEEGLVEGDLKLEPDVQTTHARRVKRSYDYRKLWPSKTIYMFVNTTTFQDGQEALRRVQEAVLEIQSRTCLKYVVSSTIPTPTPTPYHIIVQGTTGGCWTQVGYVNKQSLQVINLNEDRGCLAKGIIQHEVMHNLGFGHEHRRPDSNDYVYYHDENSRSELAFRTRTPSKHFVASPYDVASIMHYSPRAFSINGMKTLTAKQKELDGLMGLRVLSFFDIFAINEVYSCGASCQTLNCLYGGYPLSTAAGCKCVCPYGLGGADCSSVDLTLTFQCGAIITVTTTATVTSPSFPQSYPTGVKCFWLFVAPAGMPLTATFDQRFQVNAESEVEVRANHIEQRAAETYTGNEAPQPVSTKRYRGDNNMMAIIFDSSRANETGQGFSATVAVDYDACVGDPCRGAPCEPLPETNSHRCLLTKLTHCSFDNSLEGTCTDIRINDLAMDPAYFAYTWSVINGGVRAISEFTDKTQWGSARTIPKEILGTGCLMYKHNLTEAGSGELQVYQYKNGVRHVLLETHNVGPADVAQLQFEADPDSLTEIVFEILNTQPYESKKKIMLNKIHVSDGRCPGGACRYFPCGPYTCRETKQNTPRCILPTLNFICGFEDDCFNPMPFVNITNQPGSDVNWSQNRRGTPTPYTGPSEAIEGEYYLYAESSQNSGKKAIMTTAPMKAGRPYCVTFKYHMLGSSMGSLNVYKMIDGVKSNAPVWTKSGDQGNNWHEGSLSTPKRRNEPGWKVIQFAFEATFGNNAYSDMALDDLKVESIRC